MLDNYEEFQGIYFQAGTSQHVKTFIIDSIKTQRRVVVEFENGWGWIGGYMIKGDMNRHTMYIGRSTGRAKIPLEISSTRSNGGPELDTAHIKRIYYK